MFLEGLEQFITFLVENILIMKSQKINQVNTYAW